MFVLVSQFLRLSLQHFFVSGRICSSTSEPAAPVWVESTESDEPRRLNLTTETSCLRSKMGIPEREGACQFHQCQVNPREETAFLLACVSLRCRDQHSNKSVMPPFFSSLSPDLRPTLSYSSFFSSLWPQVKKVFYEMKSFFVKADERRWHNIY